MSVKRRFVITVLDYKRIPDVTHTIIKHADISMKSSTHVYFDVQPTDYAEITEDIIFFEMEADNTSDMDKNIDKLLADLNNLNTDYGMRDEDSGEMIEYVKFVGALYIKFDNLEIIKEGTYKKIDELKHYNSTFGMCKGYSPNFRPIESRPLENMKIKPETIYLFCHSQEDLMSLKEELSEKILKIEPAFKLDFKQFE